VSRVAFWVSLGRFAVVYVKAVWLSVQYSKGMVMVVGCVGCEVLNRSEQSGILVCLVCLLVMVVVDLQGIGG